MKYEILVCDPPWSYNRKSTGGTNKSGSGQQYETMTSDKLMDLYEYMSPLLNENCVLFLWTTVPMIDNALLLLRWWGFSYKTMITWVKRNNGLGNWFRGKTEHLLVGVRGQVKPFRLQAPNLIISEKTLKHSQKPIESYNLIQKCAESMNQKINILELFARTSTVEYSRSDNVNWTHIGVDITGNDIRTDLEKLKN